MLQVQRGTRKVSVMNQCKSVLLPKSQSTYPTMAYLHECDYLKHLHLKMTVFFNLFLIITFKIIQNEATLEKFRIIQRFI